PPFNLPEPIQVQLLGPKAAPTDLVLVLDKSGSMTARDYRADGNDITRLGVAAAGARLLVAALDPADDPRIAMVTYSTQASLELGLTRPSTHQTAIDDAVLDYFNDGASGLTSIGAGLKLALE